MDARDAAARDGGERGDAEPFLAVRGSVARVRLWAGFAAFVAWINLLFCSKVCCATRWRTEAA